MKLNKNNVGGILLAAMGVFSCFALQSCQDEPDKFELADGTPTIYYIRPSNVDSKDSLLVQASPRNSICLVGKNLKSVAQMYFNDQKAILNTSYITDNTLIVTVPSEIPDVVSDKIFLINKDKDTTTYAFHVVIPAPVVGAMSNEYAQTGSEVTITGSYFIDDPNTPIKVTLPDGKTITDFTTKTRNALTFTMPECKASGPFIVTSVYGETKSSFHYKDTRGLLFDFDGVTGLGNHGWHSRPIQSDATSQTGNFVQFGDGSVTMKEDGAWDDGNFAFEYWPGEWTTPLSYLPRVSQKLTDLADFANFEKMALKFEMYIPKSNPWMAGAMQLIVGGVDKITGAGGGVDVHGEMTAGANNTFFNNNVLPRGLYRPWEATGSYDTGDKWVTVTLPFSDFIYGINGGKASGNLKSSDFTSLTIFIVGGGVNGKECKPIVKIDNIRAVPYK